MSKKSYKKIQNQLYREIKKRIRAEQIASIQRRNTRIITHTAKIECLAIERMISLYPFQNDDEIIKNEMSLALATELCKGGYVSFQTDRIEEPYGELTKVQARIYVVKHPYN